MQPHRIIAVTETTKARIDWQRILGAPIGWKPKSLTVFRGFRLVLWITTLALCLGACSAMPEPGPQISVSGSFTDAQYAAIDAAVTEWNTALGLRMQTTRAGCDACVRIVVDNTIVDTMHRLGSTHLESAHPERSVIRLAVTGTSPQGRRVEEYDFQTTVLHELGHVLENWNGADALHGCDNQGHTECGQGETVMASTASLTPKHLTQADVDLVSEGLQ